ncbi:MAG: response regulator [Bacteroidota bacterium]
MGKPKSILLVDDDDTTNFLNRFFVNQVDASIAVHVVANGEEALSFMALNADEDTLPCLLILDTNMPVMNGWEFLNEFELRFESMVKKRVVIVMMTAVDTDDVIEKAMSAPNVTDTAQKPLSDMKFRMLIDKHFN